MNTVFLVCAAVGLVGQICMFRCFFLDYSLGRALGMTATGIIFTFVPSILIAKPWFGIDDYKVPNDLFELVDQLNIDDKGTGFMHHMCGEFIFLLTLLSFLWFTPSVKKDHTA